MRLDVALGSVAAAWRYAGSLTFQNWLEERPWKGSGGLCVVRMEASTCDLVFQSIQRAAHAVHSNEGEFSVRLVKCGGVAGTPQQALMRHFQLVRPPLESIADFRHGLRDTKQLLVFVEESPVDPAEWERFIALAEHLRKATSAVPLAVAVLDTRSVLSHEPTCHFNAGYVELPVFEGATALDDGAVWARYVYLRTWWDAGGCIEHARALSARCASVKVGDDEGLERAMQSYAIDALQGHAAWPTLRATHGLPGGPPRQERSQVALEAELLEAHLLWRPPGLQSLRIAPFAARALLDERLLPEAKRWSLRSTLVCAPLVSECLALCQFFEAQIRMRLHGREDRQRLPPEVEDRLREFQDGTTPYVRYPDGHPAPPNRPQDLFAFASFGETLRSCPRPAVSDPDRSVQFLRNSLAHGHYITWWHCRSALQLLRSLDTTQRW